MESSKILSHLHGEEALFYFTCWGAHASCDGCSARVRWLNERHEFVHGMVTDLDAKEAARKWRDKIWGRGRDWSSRLGALGRDWARWEEGRARQRRQRYARWVAALPVLAHPRVARKTTPRGYRNRDRGER
eukprot:scaffold147013_cov32-Tisochrysis_lutea.AAC.3